MVSSLNTLYIRLPSQAAANNVPQWLALACPFASVALGSTLGHQGVAPLLELSSAIARAQRVVLLLAASDVTLLRAQVPPLSPAKLKAALPNLVEDQLLSDPAECVIVAGVGCDGLRTLAVMQRSWLETLIQAVRSLGAHHITALPASVCLAHQPDTIAAAISVQESDTELTLRLSEQEGMGLTINTGGHETAPQEVIQTLCALAAHKPIALYVPQQAVRSYQDAVHHPDTLNKHISVLSDNWSNWIAGAQDTTLNMMAGLTGAATTSLEWRPWRWPLALAATILLVQVTALNLDWWHMKSEAADLRSTLLQIYRSAYPKETVIINPVAQMRQKIAAAKLNAGLPAPDDFSVLSAAFGTAWASVVSGKSPAISTLEYHELSLIVRLKSDGAAEMPQMKTTLAERGLSLEVMPSESGSAAWKIRSSK